ncbi:Inner membrane transport protein YajR [Buchnera aphidicola (Tetraneura ulmi)]|uniref:MFS transporter n=1 Tax=Buchnera aphidicola TaxID=9 RepID=UPI003463E51C
MKNYKYPLSEKYLILVFCFIFFLRMFGLFVISPIIPIYGFNQLKINDFWVGIAIGIYGFFQFIFQVPLGFISDIFGRKRIILFGLILFFFGSLVGAMTFSLTGLIISRILQGSGSISSIIMAFMTDLVTEENKTTSMFFLGFSFVFSFVLSIIVGPIIFNFFGFQFIYLIVSILSLLCIIITFLFLPSDYSSFLNKNKNKKINYKKIFNFINKDLKILFLSIFLVNVLLTVNFIIFSKELNFLGFKINDYWKVYLPIISIAFLAISFFIKKIEKLFSPKTILLKFIFLLFISELIFLENINNKFNFFVYLELFFIFFSFLEFYIPSLTGRIVPISYKGTIMGLFSMFQFFGTAIGGSIGGLVLSFFRLYYVIFFLLGISIFWFLFVYFFCSSMEQRNKF